MLKTLLLILPALIPSWRFFKAIEPSPRVQWTVLTDSQVVGGNHWREFRPRPVVVTPLQLFCRLFWNPIGNDALFVVSCAERIAEQPTAHSIGEINRRILFDLTQMDIDVAGKLMRFRLVFLSREEKGVTEEVVFVSEAVPVPEIVAQ